MSQISGYPAFFQEGSSYLGIVQRSLGSPKFTPLIHFNMLAMAIEKLIMAFVMSRGSLPHNHSLGDLLLYINSIEPLPSSVQDPVIQMEKMQHLCSPEDYNRQEINKSHIQEFLSAALELAAWVEPRLETGH